MTFAEFLATVPSASGIERQAMQIAWKAAIEASAREAQDTADNYYHQTGKNAANDCAARIRRLKEGE